MPGRLAQEERLTVLDMWAPVRWPVVAAQMVPLRVEWALRAVHMVRAWAHMLADEFQDVDVGYFQDLDKDQGYHN